MTTAGGRHCDVPGWCDCECTGRCARIMHLSKSSCSLRDVSSSPQVDGSAKEGRDAYSRTPSYGVGTWAILVCLVVCLGQVSVACVPAYVRAGVCARA